MLEGMVLALAIFALGIIAGAMLFLVLHWNDVDPDDGGGWQAPDYPPSDQEWNGRLTSTPQRPG